MVRLDIGRFYTIIFVFVTRYDYTTSYPDQENPEEDVDLNNLDDSGYELVLPSGTKVGHRSLIR